jgi:ribosomal protein S18 acetylase RimI-like enzyme
MNIRCIHELDYFQIVSVVNDWWGGREVAHLLPRLFFEHFQNTSFVIEEKDELIAFLVGFVSQAQPNEAYVHFVGVDPNYRKKGLARKLYERFFSTVGGLGCNVVRCITSPVNEGSITFHSQMGFSVSISPGYAGQGQDRILFAKKLRN